LKSQFQQAKAAVASQRARSRTPSELGRRSSEFKAVSSISYYWELRLFDPAAAHPLANIFGVWLAQPDQESYIPDHGPRNRRTIVRL
jgi:hypothetical protein